MEVTKINLVNDISIDSLKAQLELPTEEAVVKHCSGKTNYRAAMRMMNCSAVAQPNIQQVLTPLSADSSALLHQAISENNVEAVRFLIGHGVNINGLDTKGNTPLISALEKNLHPIAEMLINAKANLELRRKQDSFSPLEIAIAQDSPIAVQLLNAGANPNGSRPGAPCLMVQAMGKQRIDVVNLLIQKGAAANEGNPKAFNPLYQAFLLNEPARSQIVTQLLDKNADPNRRLENQTTTVFCAIVEQAVNQQGPSLGALIKKLCDKGADVHAKNASGEDALSIAKNRPDIMNILNEYRKDVPFLNQRLNEAVQSKQRNEVQKWLSKGADINNMDLNGQTVLYRTCMQGDTDFAQFLVSLGASVAKSKLPPLAEVIEKQMFQGPNLLKITEFYFRNGAAKPNDLDQNGRPLISIAVMVGNLDLVKLMIACGAKVEPSQKINGMTPLLLAVNFKNEPVARLLIENDANINAVHDGKSVIIHMMEKHMNTLISLLLERDVHLNVGNLDSNNPLAFAILSGNFTLMKQFIEKKADVNYRLENGKTALFIAVDTHQINCAEHLLPNGARHDLKDKRGHSPMWYAIQHGYQDMVVLLLKHGANHEDIS